MADAGTATVGSAPVGPMILDRAEWRVPPLGARPPSSNRRFVAGFGVAACVVGILGVFWLASPSKKPVSVAGVTVSSSSPVVVTTVPETVETTTDTTTTTPASDTGVATDAANGRGRTDRSTQTPGRLPRTAEEATGQGLTGENMTSAGSSRNSRVRPRAGGTAGALARQQDGEDDLDQSRQGASGREYYPPPEGRSGGRRGGSFARSGMRGSGAPPLYGSIPTQQGTRSLSSRSAVGGEPTDTTVTTVVTDDGGVGGGGPVTRSARLGSNRLLPSWLPDSPTTLEDYLRLTQDNARREAISAGGTPPSATGLANRLGQGRMTDDPGGFSR